MYPTPLGSAIRRQPPAIALCRIFRHNGRMQNFASSSIRNQVMSLVVLAVSAAVVTGTVVAVTRLYGGPGLSISQTTTQKDQTFDVTGTSEVTAVPDKAEVTVGIQANRPTVAETQEELNRVTAAIQEQLRDLGIDKEDIQTRNYSLNPEYRFDRGESREITGYVGSAQLVVSVTEFDTLNQVIDRATAAGANQVYGIQFSLTEEKREELRKQGREEAITEAKSSAQELARLAGMNLGRVINVTENRGGQPVPQPRFATAQLELAEDAAAPTPTQIEPGSTTVTYSVTLSYETL